MSEDDVGFVILGVIFALAILAAIVAAVKNRSGFGWFVGTLIFPPLLLLLLFLPRNRDESATAAGKPSMPSWTQPPPEKAGHDRPADLQAALRRAQDGTDSEVGKRILALAARAAQRAQRQQERQERQERRQRPPRAQRRQSEPQPRPSEAPAVDRAALESSITEVRKVSDRARQPRRGAVQRRGSRETRIYRRV